MILLTSDQIQSAHDEALGAGSQHPDAAQHIYESIELWRHFTPDATMFYVAAKILHFIARSHLFVDGNKRTALLCCQSFLALNGFCMNSENHSDFVADVASGEFEVLGISEQLKSWCF